MRWLLSFVLLAWFGIVDALSSSGTRTLVVIEDLAEKDNYSKFFEDLEGEFWEILAVLISTQQDLGNIFTDHFGL
jgi:oligosaccharyltransferase complex subunit beta